MNSETIQGEREIIHLSGYGDVYADTGELVEIDAEAPIEIQKAHGNFSSVELSNSGVEWGLGKIFHLDGDIAAANSRMSRELEAIERNYRSEINKRVRAKEGFLRWFTPMAEFFAIKELLLRNTKKDGTLKLSPEKTVKFLKGSLSFRTKPAIAATVAVQPAMKMADAVQWVQLHYPDCIVYKPSIDFSRFTRKDIESIRQKLLLDDEESSLGLALCPLEIIEARESSEGFTVTSGIK